MRRVGIDLGLRGPHCAAVFDDDEPVGRSFTVPHGKPGIDLIEARADKGTTAPCEVVMESTGLAWLPLAAELVRRGHRVFVPKPQKLHALRTFYTQYAKSDGSDARAAAMIRHVDPRGVHELRVPTAAQTSLRMLTKQRARLVAQAASAKTRIQSWLVLANSFLVAALRQPFTQLGMEFLRHFLDPFAARDLGIEGLREFWREHSRGRPNLEQCDRVWRACEQACALFGALRDQGQLPFDYALLQRMVGQQLDLIAFLRTQVDELEADIDRLYAEVDPERVLEQVPGIGPTIAPVIEAFVGDVERFSNIKEFAAYFGLVPRSKQTGGGPGRPGQRLTKGGPNLLKQYMFLAAETARRYDPTAAAAYARATGAGKHHYSAVVIVAHKLVRKLYALMRQRARARRAQLAGHDVPAVRYEYRLPHNDEVVTKAEARAYVRAQYPSKAAKARLKAEAAAGAPSVSGSSAKDATTGATDTPQLDYAATSSSCEQPMESPVGKMINRLRDKVRAREQIDKKALDGT